VPAYGRHPRDLSSHPNSNMTPHRRLFFRSSVARATPAKAAAHLPRVFLVRDLGRPLREQLGERRRRTHRLVIAPPGAQRGLVVTPLLGHDP